MQTAFPSEILSTKEFSFSERLEWARELEQLERLKADERKKANLKQNTDTQNFAERMGESNEIVADQTGFGNKETYRQAKYIADNAVQELSPIIYNYYTGRRGVPVIADGVAITRSAIPLRTWRQRRGADEGRAGA
jgi:hypothetical protein